MELVEKLDLYKINFLNSLSFKDFKTFCKKSTKNDFERKKQYNMLKNFCETNIKTRGETKRIYSYTLCTPLEVGGRLYCGNSIQNLSSKIRGFLMNGISTDIDMKNCHPCILKYLCNLHNICCPYLTFYVENRDNILLEYGNDFKKEFLKCVNDSQRNLKMRDEFSRNFDKECKIIQEKITSLEVYKDIVRCVPENKNYNWYGSAINRILCVFENKILQKVVSILNKSNIEIAVLMFDGLMIYGDYYNDLSLLKTIENFVNSEFVGLNAVFTYKNHDTCSINIPDDYVNSLINNENYNNIKLAEIASIEREKTFDEMVVEFEKKHAKIVNKGLFVKITDEEVLFLSKNNIITAYEHLTYKTTDKDGNLKIENFIKNWIYNNPKQKTYDDIIISPIENMCPSNYFNIWKKFDMENVSSYTENIEARDFILNHIKILCNYDDNVYQYFIKWISQMIQFPHIKTNVPTLISKEGAGKGSLIRLFEKMLGTYKVFQSNNPSRDVWGDFNFVMVNSYLVVLDELSKKDTINADGFIKGLITEPFIVVNSKGTNQVKVPSFHRFIISTNNEEPFNTSCDDRRKFVIRCSDDLIGNKTYFKKFYNYIDDVNVIKTMYEYFKNFEGVENFLALPVPITEYHTKLIECSFNPIENGLKILHLKILIEILWN